MAEQTAPSKKVLDISTFIELPQVRIDGRLFSLKNHGQLSVLESAELAALWRRMVAIETFIEGVDALTKDRNQRAVIKAKEAEYRTICRTYVSIIGIDIPKATLAKLGVAPAAAIIRHFYGIPQAAPTVGWPVIPAPTTPSPTGAKSSLN